MPEPEPTEYEPAHHPVEANPMLHWLARGGWSALPHWAIPPADPGLGNARAEAARAAAETGRTERVAEVRRLVADAVLHQYDAVGFESAWFVGSNDPVDRRLDVVAMVTDATIAFELWDVLEGDITVDLLARFDVYQGGPIFRADG